MKIGTRERDTSHIRHIKKNLAVRFAKTLSSCQVLSHYLHYIKTKGIGVFLVAGDRKSSQSAHRPKTHTCERGRISQPGPLKSVLFQEPFCLYRSLAARRGGTDSLTVERVGNIASGEYPRDVCPRCGPLGEDISCLICLDIRTEDI